MSDIPKPKLDPELLDLLKSPVSKQPYRPLKFGHTALSGGGLIEPRFEYTDSRSHYRPNFYEIEKNRGTQIVDMDARGEVIIAPDEEKRIATFGLCGCTAVAVAFDLPDGSRKGYVQHYSPLNEGFSADMLADAVGRGEIPEHTHARAVIMTPGEWTQDPDAKWAMEPKDELLTNLLRLTAIRGLGQDADIQVYPYSETLSIVKYGQGTLMIEFKPGAETQILAESMPVRPPTES